MKKKISADAKLCEAFRCEIDGSMDVDFQKLNRKYSELNDFYDSATGQYDFSSHTSLCTLTKVILLEYFNLQVDLSESNLCPRIPNRVAYLEFISRHIMKYHDMDCVLVDIGTGSCAIYLLLASHLSKWGLIGTEINTDSITQATKIIGVNCLSERINIVKKGIDETLLPAFKSTGKRIVTICNPPFYSSIEELMSKERMKKTHKKSELIAMSNELVTEGGEYEFIKRLLLENLFNTEVEWFTSLVGRHNTIGKLVKLMKSLHVSNFFVSKLMPDKPGRTQRWIIGWSFHPKRVVFDSFPPNQNIVKLPLIRSLESLMLRLEKQNLKCFMDSEAIHVTISQDAWSRKYRRGRIAPSGDSLGIKVEITSESLRWVYGFDYKLFQSFANFTRRVCSEISTVV